MQIIGEHLTDEAARFAEQAKECIQLYSEKNHDYGNSFEKGMDNIGMSYGVGRIYDKMNRLVTLTKEQAAIKNESIDDTLRDLACYSMMLLAYRKHKLEEELNRIDFE